MEPTTQPSSSSIKGEVKQKVSNAKEAISDHIDGFDRQKLQDKYYSMESSVRAGIKEVGSTLREGRDASEEFVKAHPFYSVLGAAAVGFIAGSLLTRRH